MIEHITGNESKIILENKEILVVTLKNRSNSLICKTYDSCKTGLTINHISKREFDNKNSEEQLKEAGFFVYTKEIEEDHKLTISSLFSNSNLDITVYAISYKNGTCALTWESSEREYPLELTI